MEKNPAVSKAISKAILARDKYLEDNPRLKAYQEEIDSILSKVPEEQRLEVLHMLALGKMMDLQNAMGDLLETLTESEHTT